MILKMKFNSLIIFLLIFLSNCTVQTDKKISVNEFKENNFLSQKGFGLVFDDDLYNKKIVSRKLDSRSLNIFHRNLEKGTIVKIINLLNKTYIIGEVSFKSNYPIFNNAVITKRIAEEINLDIKQPYIQIIELNKNSHFIANKVKTFDEEKNVANKAPIDTISISDFSNSNTKNKKEDKVINHSLNNFNYIIKVADFYFKNTAVSMKKRIKSETSIKKAKIKKNIQYIF